MWSRAAATGDGTDAARWTRHRRDARHPRRVEAPHVLGWRDIAAAISGLRARPRRLAPCPATGDRQRDRCRSLFGLAHPAHSRVLASRATPPTLAELCLVLADLAPARERAPRR
jgi:hypothetical protein